MQPDRPIADLVGMSRGSRTFIMKQLAEVTGRNRDARALFIGEDGKVRPEAERLFGRLAREAGMRTIGFEPDARRQDYRLGQQHMVRFLGEMLELDVPRLEDLQRRMEKATK